jgi:hypothetical protein
MSYKTRNIETLDTNDNAQQIDIESDHLIDLFCDAEIGYWGLYDSHQSIRDFVQKNKPLIVTEHNEESEEAPVKHVLTKLDLQIAIRVIAAKYPHHLSSIIGDYDAETGDVLVQCMCFGEIKYG